MTAIKKIYCLCHLSLLRFQLVYLAGATQRVSTVCMELYHRTMSRAFYQMSRLEARYMEETQQYLAVQNQKEGDKHEPEA